MKTGTFQKLSGEVEFDEAYIGGSPKNYSKSRRKALAAAGNLPKGGSGHKTAIVGASLHQHLRPRTSPEIHQHLITL